MKLYETEVRVLVYSIAESEEEARRRALEFADIELMKGRGDAFMTTPISEVDEIVLPWPDERPYGSNKSLTCAQWVRRLERPDAKEDTEAG